MEINYYIVFPVGLIIVLLMVWLIRRNTRDKKEYEKELIEGQKKPDKHQGEHI